MNNSVPGQVLRPAFPIRQKLLTNSLLVKNEGTRALQIIGDVMGDGERVLPGCSFEIDIARFEGPVELTFYDGGIQVDAVSADRQPCEVDLDIGALTEKLA